VTRDQVEQRIERVSWPEPSSSLRRRVLSTACVSPEPLIWTDRLWFSRAGRLGAFAAAITVIVLGQWLASGPLPSAPASEAVSQRQQIEELARLVGLPADDAAALARRARPPGAQASESEMWNTLDGPETAGVRR
jgi:hypothetical protein